MLSQSQRPEAWQGRSQQEGVQFNGQERQQATGLRYDVHPRAAGHEGVDRAAGAQQSYASQNAEAVCAIRTAIKKQAEAELA